MTGIYLCMSCSVFHSYSCILEKGGGMQVPPQIGLSNRGTQQRRFKMKTLFRVNRLLLATLFVLLLAHVGDANTAYREAPMLSKLVSEGQLPPVADRLPKEPLVMQVEEEIGTYGGTLVNVFTGQSDASAVRRVLIEVPLWFGQDNRDEIASNIFAGYQAADDGSIVTVYLREGLRWSDGHPYTADDIMFWWEDMLLYTPTPDQPRVADSIPWLHANGRLPRVTKINDYEVSFEWDEPNPLFPEILRNDLFITGILQPKHHLRQFHPRYLADVPDQGPEAVERFQVVLDYLSPTEKYWNPGTPSLEAWVTKVWDGRQLLLERNPYYFKVDPAGNQLPYIDYVRFDVIEDRQLANIKAMAGEIDFQFRHIDFQNYTALVENEERGNYRTLLWQDSGGAAPNILLNHNCKDPVLRELIRSKEFRAALSLAIDRELINEMLWYGLATPMQGTAPVGTPFYVEGMDRMYAEYAPDQANALLDGLGLTQRNRDGIRMRPDNQPLTLYLDLMSPGWPSHTETFELVQDFWKQIGVDLKINVSERSLYHMRIENNEHQLAHWNMDRTLMPTLDPQSFLPIAPDQNAEAPLYAKWYATNGREGEVPEDVYAEMYRVYQQVVSTVDAKERNELFKKIVRLHAENVMTIGTVGLTPVVGVASNRLRNVPEKEIQATEFRTPRNAQPEQFFFVD